jgi:hypothetical protein
MDTDFENDLARNGMIPKEAQKREQRFHELFAGKTLAPAAAWAVIFGDTTGGLAYILSPPERPHA